MALTIPIVEQAILEIVKNPATYYPAGHADTNRAQAAADLGLLTYGAWVGNRPQSDDGPLAVTISRTGGLKPTNTDSFSKVDQPIVDLTTWALESGNRVSRQSILQFGALLEVLLVGLQGNVAGVEITTIHQEGLPFEADEPPRDKSDNWQPGYVYPLLVHHVRVNATNRVATVA